MFVDRLFFGFEFVIWWGKVVLLFIDLGYFDGYVFKLIVCIGCIFIVNLVFESKVC